jgi:SNF2 family DNA or RNA helicase
MDMFGSIETRKLMNTANIMKEAEVLVGFKNLSELRQVFFEYTEMKSAEDVGLKIPAANEKHVLSVMTPLQKRVYAQLRERAKEFLALSGAERAESGDHIFSIMSDMQKASISLSLLKKSGSVNVPTITDEELAAEPMSPKLQQCIENSVETHKAGERKLIFCEAKDVQQELMEQLVSAGVPKNKIVIVNADTAKTSDSRMKISQDYNAGKYSIVIGNKTMNEGMNFQVDTAAIDHLDIPYTPSDIVQRNGRSATGE